jgi:hypothetical protein
MANKTDRRGRGFAPQAVKIKAEEGKALRALLMERHDYSAEEAFAALLSGELVTILIEPDERRHLVAWLEQQAATMDDALLAETVRSLARQLAPSE